MKKVLSLIPFLFLFCLILFLCTSCKKRNSLVFEKIEGKNEYRVVSIEELNDGNIIIPSEYKGFPVTEIGARAFAGDIQVVSVYIPDSVVVIGEQAFDDCRNLESIRLPQYLEVIPARMTRNTKIETITIPGSVKRIESRAFCTADIKDIVIPDSVEYIGYEAFYSCVRLETVTIGSNIQEIQPYAFRYCDSLKSVTFKNPDNITLFGFTFNEGILNAPEKLPFFFLDEQYACRHWFAKEKSNYQWESGITLWI